MKKLVCILFLIACMLAGCAANEPAPTATSAATEPPQTTLAETEPAILLLQQDDTKLFLISS